MNAQKNSVSIIPVPETACRASTLAASLPLEEMLGFFAGQLRTFVHYDSFEYRNLQHATHLNLGTPGLHSCHYQIRTEGLDLGRITVTRTRAFENNEINRIESALGVLSMQLSKAMDMLQDRMTLLPTG